MHCPRCKKLQTTSSSTHYSCSCGHRWPLERASSTTTTTTTMTTTTTATATKAIILPSTERPIRTYPERIGDIIRRDQDFVFLPEKGRIGGASLSSGIFQEKGTGALWLGKCHHPLFKDHARGILDEEKIEGEACAEKIPNDIYAYYGAEVPEMALSRQPMVNTGLEEDNRPNRPVVHVMCKLRTTAKTYDKLPQFRCVTPNPNGYLLLPDGQRLVERGLGRILAVANFINDIDVIGIGGGNVMYDIVREPDQNRIYAQTLKIDPGYAFTREEDEDPPQIVPPKQIRAAHPRFPDKPNLIRFIDLPPHTQRDYLLTLHLIVRTNEATIRGFFTRRGGERFLVYSQRSVDSYVAQLCQRRDRLQQEYANELQATLELFQQTQPDYNPEQQEETHSLQSLYFYIPPQMKNPTSQIPELTWNWETLESHFLKKPYRVLLLQGESGSGKSLSLAWLKKHLLAQHRTLEEQRRALEESQTRLPDKKHAFEKLSIQLQQLWRILVIDLKRYHRDNVIHCLNEAIEEAHAGSIADWRRRFILLVLDGYDEIGGGNTGNLYNRLKLAEWPQLKLIITCRSAFLQSGYQSDFIPGREQEKFVDYKLCPFTPKHIQEYLVRYLSQQEEGLLLEDYQRRFEETSGLKELIETPLLLRIACDALPQLRSGEEVTRTRLYEAFLRQWFANQTKRLQSNPALKALSNPLDAFLDFSRRLALHMAKANAVEITYEGAINSPWAAFFEDRHPEIRLARQGCPLIRSGNRYSFLHRSFLDYFTARGIWDALQLPPTAAAQVTAWVLDPSYILRDSAVIELLHELAGGGFTSVDHIVAWMVRTREDRSDLAAHAAACAATLLNALQRSFSPYDLHDVRIPQADLRGADLSDTDLQNAELAGVQISGASLAGTQLQGAILHHLKLGQKPWIEMYSKIRAIAYHPTQPLLAISQGNDIILRDLRTNGANSVILIGHRYWVTDLAFSPDGRTLISGSDDRTIRFWDIINGTSCSEPLNSGTKSLVAFHPDGYIRASVIGLNTIELWDVATNIRRGAPLIGHTGSVTCLAFSPDGHTLASGSTDHTIRLWDIDTSTEIDLFMIGKAATCLAFSPGGHILASGSSSDETVRDGTLHFWVTSTIRGALPIGHRGSVTCLAFSPNNHILVSGSNDGTLRLWDATTNIRLGAPLIGHTGSVTCLAFSPDGHTLASGSTDHTIRLWKANSSFGSSISLIGHTGPVTCLSFSPDGQTLASSGRDETIRFWDMSTGSLHGEPLREHDHFVSCIAFSPDGDTIASGGFDKNLRLWNVTTGIARGKILFGHRSYVNCLAYSPDGRSLASGSGSKMLSGNIDNIEFDNDIRIWDVASGTTRHVLGNSNSMAIRFQFAGNRVNDKFTITGHTAPVICLAYSHNGCVLASGAEDCTLRLWDSNTGMCRQTIPVRASIHSLAFSRIGRLALGLSDGSIVFLLPRETQKGIQYVTAYSTQPNTRLLAQGCNLTDAQGLKPKKLTLLRQLGAKGQPVQLGVDKQSTLEKAQSGAGDAQAQYELDNLYLSGHGAKQDETQAKHWYHQSAQAGYHPLVQQYVEAELRQFSLNFQKNSETSYRCWKQLPFLVKKTIADIMQTVLNQPVSISSNPNNPFGQYWDNCVKPETKQELVHYACYPQDYLKALKKPVPTRELLASTPWLLSWQQQMPEFRAFLSEATQKIRHKANCSIESYWNQLSTQDKKVLVEKFRKR